METISIFGDIRNVQFVSRAVSTFYL